MVLNAYTALYFIFSTVETTGKVLIACHNGLVSVSQAIIRNCLCRSRDFLCWGSVEKQKTVVSEYDQRRLLISQLPNVSDSHYREPAVVQTRKARTTK